MQNHAHGSFCAYQSSQVILTALLKIFPANVWNRGKAANKRCHRVMKLNPRKRLKTWKQWKTQLPKERKRGKRNENEENKKAKSTLGFLQNRPPVRPDCTLGPPGRPAQILYLSTSGKKHQQQQESISSFTLLHRWDDHYYPIPLLLTICQSLVDLRNHVGRGRLIC